MTLRVLAVDVQIRQDHLLHAVVIPLIARDHLVVPLQHACVHVNGHDRGYVEVVAAGAGVLGAKRLRPRLGIACADVHQSALGVVGYPVPYRTASAELPPFALPSGGGLAHRLRLETLGGIAGDGVELPDLAAGVRIVGGKEAARRTVAASRANDHFSLGDARGNGQCLLVLHIADASFPDGLAGVCVERHQPAIVHGNINLVVIERQPAIHYAAAHFVAGRFAVDFRIPAPFLLAGARVDGEHDTPVGDAKNSVVPFERRGFLVASAFADFIGPDQAEALHIGRVDQRERTKTRLARCEAVGQPVAIGRGLRGIP